MTAPGRLRVRRLVVGLLVLLAVMLVVVALTASEERLPETLWVRVLPPLSDEDWDDMRLGPDGDRYRGGFQFGAADGCRSVAPHPPLVQRALTAIRFPGAALNYHARWYDPTGVEREAGRATWREFRIERP
jgi:hypothetical protein